MAQPFDARSAASCAAIRSPWARTSSSTRLEARASRPRRRARWSTAPADSRGQRSSSWVDRAGARSARPSATRASTTRPALSPDETQDWRSARHRTAPGAATSGCGIWPATVDSRVTFDGSTTLGAGLVARRRHGSPTRDSTPTGCDIYVRAASGAGTEDSLPHDPGSYEAPFQWSDAANAIVLGHRVLPERGRLDDARTTGRHRRAGRQQARLGPAAARPAVTASASWRHGSRRTAGWLAYDSNETGALGAAGYPLTTRNGRSRATRFARSAPSTTRTTSATSL